MSQPAFTSTEHWWSDDWDDLEVGKEQLYGSQKEQKMPINAIIVQKEEWPDHKSWMIFWLYKWTDYPKYKSTYFLPFYYNVSSKMGDARKKTWIVNYFHKERRGHYDFMTFFPFYQSHLRPLESDRNILYLLWWGKDSINQESNYLTLLPIFYYKSYLSQDNMNSGNSLFLPFYYRSVDHFRSPARSYKDHIQVSPLHYFHSKSGDDHTSYTTWWMPIVPLVFYHSSKNNTLFNFFWILDFSWKENYLRRFYFLPFLYYQKDFSGSRQDVSTYSPLHIYQKTVRKDARGNIMPDAEWETRFGFPIVPFLYYSYTSNRQDSHRTLFGLIDWTNRQDGSLKRLFVIPVLFYKQDSYFHLPTFLYFSSWDKYEFTNASPLWYYNNSLLAEKKETTFAFPVLPFLYYRHHSNLSGTSYNILTLFNYKQDATGKFYSFWAMPFFYWQAGEGGYRIIAPFYFRPSGWTIKQGFSFGTLHYHRWDEKSEVLHFFPLYYSWENIPLFDKQKTSASIFFPVWVRYQDETMRLNLYLWGGSWKKKLNPFSTTIALNIGRKENLWYADADFSWLYDFFSISTRKVIYREKDNKETPLSNVLDKLAYLNFLSKNRQNEWSFIDEKKVRPKTDEPHLTKEKRFTREDSVDFFGWRFLFGILAYERADARLYHFRLLPLAWITWDEKSKNKVNNVFPVFFSYQSEDTEYFVLYPALLPLYGMSREGQSYNKVYLLNMLWREYDHYEEMHETSIVWPFINYYKSPKKSGWRFFPIIWRKKETTDQYHSSTIYSPFVYYNWLQKEYQTKSSLNIPVLPLFRQTYLSQKYSDREITEKRIFFFPLVYKSTDIIQTNRAGISKRTEENTWFSLPIVYHHSKQQEIQYPKGTVRINESTLFFPGYYQSETPDKISHSVLFLTYWSEYKKRNDTFFMFFPLYFKNKNNYETNYWITPFSQFTWTKNYNSQAVLGLFWRKERYITPYNQNSDYYNHLLPIWMYFSDKFDSNLTLLPILSNFYQEKSDKYNSQVLLGLIWRKNDNRYNSNRYYLHFLPLWWYQSRDYGQLEKGRKKRTVLSPILPVLFFYHGHSEDAVWALPILLTGHSWREQTSSPDYNYYSTMVLGSYWHKSKWQSRQNLWYLFDHISDYDNNKELTREQWSMFFYLIHYEKTSTFTDLAFAYGLAGYKNYRNSQNWNVNLLWLGYKRNESYQRWNFLPLIYYSFDNNSSTMIVPPLLQYYDREKDSIFHLIGLGALYYRNYQPYNKEDRAMLLMGTLFSYTERPRNNYKSWSGPLWGILWDYEEEDQGGWNKFSILKFVYQRVDDHGRKKYRVMGVRF